MNGILNYAAPRRRSRKAMTFGIVSTGIATAVFALPLVVSGAALLLQAFFSRPGSLFAQTNVGMMIVFLPSLAMLVLPLLGLFFGAWSMAANRRDCECAVIGLIINISGLISAVGAILLH